jgi:trehalose 6-phosphate synthase/phosphatase
MNAKRLIVVSNRLPVTLTNENGTWKTKAGSGGLATAMEPILTQTGGLWIGWTGDHDPIDPETRATLLREAAEGYSYVPVDFPPGAGTAFYEGYPNQAVWPLFHLFPSRMNFDPDSWAAYVEGNRTFGHTVLEHVRPGDAIWIHDYHLMLLPQILRAERRDLRIGFFLHIPFPSSEVLSLLPHAAEILEGLLGADFIAFQTYRYLHHFRSSLLRILGLESEIESMQYHGHTTRFTALPIGIAPEPLTRLLENDDATRSAVAELRTRYQGQKVAIAVDRLDYTKGIPERLRAFRRLLQRRKDLWGGTTLIQVAVPSREGIGEYRSLRDEINQLVGEIDGEFATAQWTPVVFLRHPVTRPELAALYSIAGVGWVTPLRDGMNLVAKEYCACKLDEDGVLVLSEFAGAAAEMGEALLVNPYDEEQVVDALQRAFEMPADERTGRMKRLRARVLKNDVFDWANRFLNELERATPAKNGGSEHLEIAAIAPAYESAQGRLIVLDYDGTLTPIVSDPDRAAPQKAMLETLARIAADPRNVTAVVSGRRAADLEKWLGGIPRLLLAAEHGALIRPERAAEWQPLAPSPSLDWKPRIRSILQEYTARAPGSLLEEKEFSIAWHYRRMEPEFGEWLAGELAAILGGLLAETDARPVTGKKIVEVRPVWANKGALLTYLIDRYPDRPFHLIAGDDSTDEDMFERATPGAFTVHVGGGHSRARYEIDDPEALVELLGALAAIQESAR